MARGGLVADVRGVASDALRIARTRLELLAIEFQEEKARIVRQALVASATLLFACFGILLALMCVVLAIPEQSRPAVVGALGLMFFAASGACAWWLSNSSERTPFTSTIGTLTRDEGALRGGDD